jgi:hypothetical protein
MFTLFCTVLLYFMQRFKYNEILLGSQNKDPLFSVRITLYNTTGFPQ